MSREDINRRSPAKRLYRGIAGSPLAEIIPFPAPEPGPQQPSLESSPVPAPAAPKKRGRPRKYADNAAKQKTFRERKASGAVEIDRAAKEAAQKPPVSTKNRLTIPVSEMWYMPGRGKHLTGGYREKQIQEAEAENERAEHGGRVTGAGHGPNLIDNGWGANESIYKFTRNISFPKHDPWDEGGKQKVVEEVISKNTTIVKPCEDDYWSLETDAENYPLQWDVIYCRLCKKEMSDEVVEKHFRKKHRRLISKAVKEARPKSPPALGTPTRKCYEDHGRMAVWMEKMRIWGPVECQTCHQIIYDSEYRNKAVESPKPNDTNELTQKIDFNAIKGESTESSNASRSGIEETPKTTETTESSEEDRPL